ncbi:zinc phosphodiesterase ELAC protein 1 [Lingula anatina]|uniref:Zinc phosphodiesterase ELAC protein 1 n=1 Tax=Lingula anatina TaxID=7574 RepID=A0A1S3IPU5_LINAN|nr:zinc phosphodiesterase ELAC protein 1 [Lingula anatina]|eukprot:XP_013400245.1 zinc phosphodiesterase ELAC protein 1 [Lingula anatina]
MELHFMGTASAYPTPVRGASCIIFRRDSDCWMFDCGEGSQTQVMKSTIKPGKISKIFITHLHGDHVFGLPGLLCTIGQNSTPDRLLEIYGPQGLRKFLRVNLELSRSMLGFDYVVHELIPIREQCNCVKDWETWSVDHEAPRGPLHPYEKPGMSISADKQGVWHLLEESGVSVKASWLTHRIPSFGFVIQQASQPGRLNVDVLKAKGILPGPLYAKIKRGEAITAPSGELVKPEDVLGPDKPGKKVVILGDTSNSDSIASIAQGADVLVHETTLENDMVENAIEKGHSTPAMAAAFANMIGARHLIITHFSQRYRPVNAEITDDCEDPSVLTLLKEAQEGFGLEKVTAAFDLMSFTIR